MDGTIVDLHNRDVYRYRKIRDALRGKEGTVAGSSHNIADCFNKTG